MYNSPTTLPAWFRDVFLDVIAYVLFSDKSGLSRSLNQIGERDIVHVQIYKKIQDRKKVGEVSVCH